MAQRGQLRILVPVRVSVGVLVAVDSPREVGEDGSLTSAEMKIVRDLAEEAAADFVENKKLGPRGGHFDAAASGEWRWGRPSTRDHIDVRVKW